ncbi:DUF6222 family protein [Amycolatopsis sp. A133]|jgi:hypothetical protein|uniref:DUF6222 family protein n=1 Tax=Amycolatopsis sp. A133 TaxID=3064472 RepID=UPI0027EC012C|nr:DUF6222 family protein [Amycolatopsis sp. A133]MDQ7806730.1 DUF6222 family protein [Amycolatopsis sp. A133]
MTASDAARAGTGDQQPVRLAADPVPAGLPVDVPVRPMPRLGRGIVWSDIVAEIERDERARMRDAA